MADDGDGTAAKPPKAGDDGAVIAVEPIPRERGEFGDQLRDIVGEVRPGRMPRHQRLLPRRQTGIGLADKLIDLRLQTLDLVVDGNGLPLRAQLPKIFDLAFQFGDGLFEVEENIHGEMAAGSGGRRGWRSPRPKSISKVSWPGEQQRDRATPAAARRRG